MSTVLPIDWIKLSNGTQTLLAPTNNTTLVGATPGVWVAEEGVKGLFERGASSAISRTRAFANGSVLGKRINFAGKVVSLKFIVAGDIKANLALIDALISTPKIQLSSDWSDTIYNAQFQTDGQVFSYNNKNNTFTVSLIFTCEEAV